MNKSIIINHMGNSNTYSDIDLIMYKICFHGAPTINKVKPSSLICFRNSETAKLKDIWDECKSSIKELIPFDFKEVKICDDGVNVLFYWNDWIDRIIKSSKVSKYLNDIGYENVNSVDEVLDILSNHFVNGCPHEIGVFLGYPLSDVIEFSSMKNKECLCVGYWKVYSNLQRAKKIFDLYDKTRVDVVNLLDSGLNPLEIVKIYSSQRLCA